MKTPIPFAKMKGEGMKEGNKDRDKYRNEENQ
jgi:hypothetical protein